MRGLDTEKSLRIQKMWPVSMVKVRDALSREFKVLRLVFADWDMCCPFPLISFISLQSPPSLQKAGGDTYL